MGTALREAFLKLYRALLINVIKSLIGDEYIYIFF